jgi:hypothetical protein
MQRNVQNIYLFFQKQQNLEKLIGEVTLGEETETILNEMIVRGSNFVIGEVTLGEKPENIFNEMIGRGNNFVIGEITLGEDTGNIFNEMIGRGNNFVIYLTSIIYFNYSIPFSICHNTTK